MERNGKMFAEAIPVDIDAVAESLAETITESRRRQAGAPAQKH
jgi:hypothetical protein